MPAKPLPPATSESVDDYLKAILELGGVEDSRVTTNALAERLGVRTPSVTGFKSSRHSARPWFCMKNTEVSDSLLLANGGRGN